jgi:hypothetical protein
LIWNTKLGKDRFLDIDPSTGIQDRFPKNPGDPNILDVDLQRLRLFEACLITMTSNCKQLPDWVAPINNTKQQAAIRNQRLRLVDINDKQRNALIDAFNASRHSQIYRINHHQSTSKNSLYLDPIIKPYDCLICGGNHSGNNAKLCYSANGSIYIKCFASNLIEYLDKDVVDPVDSDDDSEDDSEDDNEPIPGMLMDPDTIRFLQQEDIKLPEYVLKSIERQSVNECGNNKLYDNSSINDQRRVQSIPIIGGLINNDALTAIVNDGLTSGGTNHVVYMPYNKYINSQNVKSVPPEVKVGQIRAPSAATTIASYLDGNNNSSINDQRRVQAINRSININIATESPFDFLHN